MNKFNYIFKLLVIRARDCLNDLFFSVEQEITQFYRNLPKIRQYLRFKRSISVVHKKIYFDNYANIPADFIDEEVFEIITKNLTDKESYLHIIVSSQWREYYNYVIIITSSNLFVCKDAYDENKFEINSYCWQDICSVFFIEGEESANIFFELNDGFIIKFYNLSKKLARQGFEIAQRKISGKQNIKNRKARKLFINFYESGVVFDTLKQVWNPDYIHPKYKKNLEIEWLMSMTNQFIKDIHTFDRKMQGRILEAISEIVSQPTTIKGDTIKPLTSDKKGLWRYRIGDYRLIYHPDIKSRKITLMNFASRGDIYD